MSAIIQIENLSNNWLALGGGGGTTGVPGSLTQTGSFHLDTGDAASRGELILTNTLNDQTLELASLSGSGGSLKFWLRDLRERDDDERESENAHSDEKRRVCV